jgi:hypothetical protein
MKNIAAEQAFKDGCDYIVWHDIDMIPEDDHCDYSFPKDNPLNITTHRENERIHKKNSLEFKEIYENIFNKLGWVQ